MTLRELYAMNNDWDCMTLFEIHTYEDWTNTNIRYSGPWEDMPMKFGDVRVRAFGTVGKYVYIEMEKE